MRMRKFLAVLLALTMLLTLLPLNVSAESDGNISSSVNTSSDELIMTKTATLEKDGTYTINLKVYATNNPIATYVRQDTPLDIVLVIDQSGSIVQSGYLDDLKLAVDEFISQVAAHGRSFQVEHRIAVVGFASNETDGASGNSKDVFANSETSKWVNTGIFDGEGVFHNYGTTGFTYTAITSNPVTSGTYYVLVSGIHGESSAEYRHLFYHDVYYHLMNEADAIEAVDAGTQVYGFAEVNGESAYVELTLSSKTESGTVTTYTWNYNDGTETKQYNALDFYTKHTDVWTHRDADGNRQIHAYGSGTTYKVVDSGHTDTNVYTRTAGTDMNNSIYHDALMSVTVSNNGAGTINPSLEKIVDSLGSSGATRAQYGIELANEVFAAHNEEADAGRKRIMVVFTDGEPGQSGFLQTEANAAIADAYITKNNYDASVYTVGLYDSTGTSNVDIYMNALSSNYPHAETMSDAYASGGYTALAAGTELSTSDTYYVRNGYNYRQLQYGTVNNRTGWYFTTYWGGTSFVSTSSTIASDGHLGESNYSVYQYTTAGYLATENSGYYQTSDDVTDLYAEFSNILKDITTYTTSGVKLHGDTILRDIMGTGLELTDNTEITATLQKGVLSEGGTGITWLEGTDDVTTLGHLELDLDSKYRSDNTVDLHLFDAKGNPIWETDSEGEILTDDNGYNVQATKDDVPVIAVYNTCTANTASVGTYHPHTVDITGFKFHENYINAEHTSGARLIVKITKVEAQDDVIWSHSQFTNSAQSGIWSPDNPATTEDDRTLLASFYQPTTVFVKRAYVLDYAKTMTVTDAYYTDNDDTTVDGKVVHLDGGIGTMDGFTTAVTSYNGKYGVASIDTSGVLTYTPNTMNWTGYDQFYAFGNTTNGAINVQDANSVYGNLWSKITVIPANSVYYEDTFVESIDGEAVVGGASVGIEYSGKWTTATEGSNTENPESTEEGTGAGVQGWEDTLADDTGDTNGTSHEATVSNSTRANATFRFTGTGVDIYSRTTPNTGTILAMCYEVDGESKTLVKAKIIDTKSASGTYYNIPTCSFSAADGLTYGTYEVVIEVTAAAGVEGRYTYFLDGIRVYNPLSSDVQSSTTDTTISDAYGSDELNVSFQEVRDMLIDANTTTTEGTETTEGEAATVDTFTTGPVFIDLIEDGQDDTAEELGTGYKSAVVGNYEDYGPKHEVYLSQNQGIAFQVSGSAASNSYYIGLKAPEGKEVAVNVNGTVIRLSHTADMYYKVTPDANGMVSITSLAEIAAKDENGDDVTVTFDGLLSVTKLKTNYQEPVAATFARVRLNNLLGFVTDVVNTPVDDSDITVEPETPEAEDEIINNPNVEIVNPEPEDTEETETPSINLPNLSVILRLLDRIFNDLYSWFN